MPLVRTDNGMFSPPADEGVLLSSSPLCPGCGYDAGPRVLASVASPQGWRHPSHSSAPVICPGGPRPLSTVLSGE